MTPEERATKVCRDSRWTIEPWKYDLIVTAIRAAVEVEREACALMCDEWGQGDCDASISALDFEKKYGDQIDLSAYIRARKDTP